MIALSPVPVHFLGNRRARAVLLGGLQAVRVLRFAAVPAVVVGAGVAGGLALAVLLAAIALHARRRPRAIGAPLAEEAVFFLGAAAVLVVARGELGGALAGVGLALAFAAAWAAGVALAWGWAPEFVVMRQPTFRVIGDNPDARTWVARMRVRGGVGRTIAVPNAARGPVTVAATRLGLGVAGAVSYRELTPFLAAHGQATVHLGGAADPRADFSLVVPDGRYFVSVRYYQPSADEGPTAW